MRGHAYSSPFYLRQSTILQNIMIVLLANLVLAVVAQIAIPWQAAVPLTFQSAMVVLLGLTLGSTRAVSVVALYLIEGFSGFPVFAGGFGGFPHFSTGYLIGFLPAAYLSGWLMERGAARTVMTTFLASMLSASCIFGLGILCLQALVGWHNAVVFGLVPFLGVEPLKLFVISMVARRGWLL